MGNRNSLVFRITVVALLVLAVWFFVFGPDDGALRVSVFSDEKITEDVEIRFEYPQFPDLPKQFNDKIRTLVDEEVRVFQQNVSESENELTVESAPFYLSLGWTPVQLNKEMISILVRTSLYTGGAHGSENVQTFTYDIVNKEEVTLRNLFADTPDYLNKISQFAINDLKTTLYYALGSEPNINMIMDGASPKETNFSRFTLSSSGVVTFYFPQYQVAPYAAGEQVVRMPLSFVSNMGKNEYRPSGQAPR
jgi:hypothetical protein